MRYTWIDEYLLGKAGVTKDIQRDWNWLRYQIGGKMFAAVCLGEDDEPYYITLKLEPSEGDFLRQQYEDIVPGYYMNKMHWNSIKPDGEVPDDLLKDLLDKSYQLVLEGFSKKKQREILGEDAIKGQVALENSQQCGGKTEPLPKNHSKPSVSASKGNFDYKKEYKEFYMPKNKPGIVEVPPMNYIAVRGKGNPNEEGSEYKQSIGLLYAIAFTIKMSKKGEHQIDGYFDYVVPPLEGFWWQENAKGNNVHDGGGEGKDSGILDYTRKEDFRFISVIRLPDFVTREDFRWAAETAAEKKKQDFSRVEFFTYEEGMCVQCMHIGSYDDEPETIKRMHQFMEEQGYELDITEERFHHEIYLSDARRVAPERLKTVVRHPVRKR